MKRITILALVLSSFAIAACGGGSNPEDEVTDVANQINQAETKEEIEQVCRDLISPAFLDEVYGGDVGRCVKTPINNEDEDENPGTTEVESVEVDGSDATAQMVAVGGDADGSGGAWSFIEGEDGWQLDRLEDDFLRSALITSVGRIDEGAFGFEPVRECMSGELGELASPGLRTLMFRILRGEKQRVLKSVLKISESCPNQMAQYVADELATRVVAREGATPAQVNCARKELVPLLQVTGLTEIAMSASISPDGGASGPAGAALAGLVAGVMKECPAK